MHRRALVRFSLLRHCLPPVALGCRAGELCDRRWSTALLKAYPEHLERIDGERRSSGATARACRSTTARATRAFEAWLERSRHRGHARQALSGRRPRRRRPAKDNDPGRARNAAFFDKIYGDCRKGEVDEEPDDVAWLPTKASQRLRVHARSMASARALEAVSGRARRAAGIASTLSLFRRPAPTIAAPSPAPTASPRTATASPSTSR